MSVIICNEDYTPTLVLKNPDKLFVFGDNLAGFGKRGQAVIRGLPNTFGVPTKRYPSLDPSSFFADRPDELQALERTLEALFLRSLDGDIVLPKRGLGTGLADLKARSPLIHQRLSDLLYFYFRFRNPD